MFNTFKPTIYSDSPSTTSSVMPTSSVIPTSSLWSTHPKISSTNPISLKNSLEEVLGTNKEKYWLSIQSFIKGEINKIELDLYVHSLLPKEHVHLHDEFIRASIKLKNTRKRKQSDDCDVKRITSNRKSANMDSNLMLFEKKFPKNTTVDEDFIDPSFIDPSTLTTIPPSTTFSSEDEFSEFDSIYTKMTEIALDNGLIGGVSEDCANLMICALETHLKNFVHNCIDKVRLNDFHDEKEKSCNLPISLSDLAFSIELSPYILVENNFILERILNKIHQKS